MDILLRIKRLVAKLYVIKSFSYSGTLIYTKGTIVSWAGEEFFYLLVSSKIVTRED